MYRKQLSLGVAFAAAAVLAAPSTAAQPVAKPVPSLTPAATQKLWRKLVAQPRVRATRIDCAPVRTVFYAGTDWLRLTTKLAAQAAPCTDYFVSVPPLVADKTQPRADQAWRIRALGPAFHALAEINVTGWSNWVATTGNTWYAAGVEARRRMAATGYDVNAGDTWVLNELSSAVRIGSGNARANMRSFIRGLYDGDGTVPATRGAVFISGMSQATGELSVYQSRLQDWYEDTAFWNDMSAYVSDWSQELYGDVRNYAVPGADFAARRDSLNDYLQHELALARVAPEPASAATAFLASAYNPLANGAWQYDAAFGWTNVTYDLMQHYVSAQTAALRAFGGSRYGFAWAPKNLSALPAADFAAQTDAILDRLAASIADADPCGGTWCAGDLDGSWLNNGWRTFAAWKPAQLAFATAPQTIAAGAASQPLTVELRTNTGLAYTAGAPLAVTLSATSGELATSTAGPWSATLTTAIASGTTSATVYFRDTQAGTPVVTASAAGKVAATQTETVTAPPADTTPPETSISSAPAGTVASTSAAISFASEPGARFECALDGTVFTACTSPVAYSALAQGAHTFDVRAADAAGNVDATPARAAWSVDTVAPAAAIASGPSGVVASTSASIAFSSEPVARFECSLDGAAFAACTSPASYSALAQGAHTFAVRATDDAGNAGTAATRAWTVDTVAPNTTLTQWSRLSSSSARFWFTATESASFQCALDYGAWSACTSPKTYTGLAKGTHTIRVRATDAAGNVDATPATFSWKV